MFHIVIDWKDFLFLVAILIVAGLLIVAFCIMALVANISWWIQSWKEKRKNGSTGEIQE